MGVLEEVVPLVCDVETTFGVVLASSKELATEELEVGEALTTAGGVSSILCTDVSRGDMGHEKPGDERVDRIIKVNKNIMVYSRSRYVEYVVRVL